MQITTQLLGFIVYGVQWVLWLLIGLSVVSIAVMLERFWFFLTYRKDETGLAADIRELLKNRGAPSAAGDAPRDAVLTAAAEGAKAQERLRLERRLAFLGTLGSNAPFVGLFGTVLGIIKAFQDLAGNQSGGPAVVMAGISEALVATAVGLLVAIPAVVAFNYFNRRVRTTMTQVEWRIELALLRLRTEAPHEGVAEQVATAASAAKEVA